MTSITVNLKLLKNTIGVLISIGLVTLGFVITNYAEHGFWVFIFSISVPFIGWRLFKRVQKTIGMLISSVFIALSGIIFIIISGLH